MRGGDTASTPSNNAFRESSRRLAREVADYEIAERRWDSPVARVLARQSVAQWMASQGASKTFEAGLRGLRGFFLADPEELSLIALVDQLAASSKGASTPDPSGDRSFRIRGGNGALPQAIARRLRAKVKLQHVVRRIVQSRRRRGRDVRTPKPAARAARGLLRRRAAGLDLRDVIVRPARSPTISIAPLRR